MLNFFIKYTNTYILYIYAQCALYIYTYIIMCNNNYIIFYNYYNVILILKYNTPISRDESLLHNYNSDSIEL